VIQGQQECIANLNGKVPSIRPAMIIPSGYVFTHEQLVQIPGFNENGSFPLLHGPKQRLFTEPKRERLMDVLYNMIAALPLSWVDTATAFLETGAIPAEFMPEPEPIKPAQEQAAQEAAQQALKPPKPNTDNPDSNGGAAGPSNPAAKPSSSTAATSGANGSKKDLPSEIPDRPRTRSATRREPTPSAPHRPGPEGDKPVAAATRPRRSRKAKWDESQLIPMQQGTLMR